MQGGRGGRGGKAFFSDESRYCLQKVDGRIRVWRRRGERHSANCIVERDRNSVCVLGAIGIGHKTDMVHFNGYVNAQVYMDKVINDQLVPLFAARPNLTFMHDNARPHSHCYKKSSPKPGYPGASLARLAPRSQSY